jgi:pseudomonalisin
MRSRVRCGSGQCALRKAAGLRQANETAGQAPSIEDRRKSYPLPGELSMIMLHKILPKSLPLALSLALLAVVSLPAQAVVATGATVAGTTALRDGDVRIGVAPGAQAVHITVALKLRNRDLLDAMVAAHQKLAPGQFAAQHAPTQQQATAVAQYLTGMGFRNVVIAPNLLLVSADGTAAAAQAAFATTFASVKTLEGRAAFANDTDAHIPLALQDSVLSVIGLQNVYQAHSLVQTLPAGTNIATATVTGHNPVEFSSIYGGTGVPTAAGVSIGIVSQGDLTQTIADLNSFTAANGLPTVATQIVATNGTSTDVSNMVEWNLDSQTVVGMGGGRVGQIVFYAIPSLANTDLVANINTIVTANAVKIINVSLGECETSAQSDGSAAATAQLFQVAVAQGQTFSISTGDSGANECGPFPGIKPSWPANSPYVVAVTGSLLNATPTTWNGEVVWNNLPLHGASGGSPSTYELKPAFQNALVPGTMRGVADITFDASPFSGALVYVNGVINEIGGTSLAAPIFSGWWARVIAVDGPAVGFAAPLLYQLPQTDFHDVVSGDNGGETAAVGYDFASGRGSPILNRAIAHIVAGTAPAPTNVAPVANFGFTTLGLVGTFTDRSTDSDGTIAAHAWTFGDGVTSKLANPIHVYTRVGTYNISETVTDNGGATNAKTVTATVARP